MLGAHEHREMAAMEEESAEMKRQNHGTRQPTEACEVPARSGVEASAEELAALRPLATGINPFGSGRVSARLSGGHRSAICGRGMEFAEVRAYVPGDEVRHMDWRVTARTGKPHSKLFVEERERPVIVAADMRESMRFGTRQCFKSVAAARGAALVAWAVIHRGDRVGGVTLSGRGLRIHRMRRDRNGSAALIAGLADATTIDCESQPSSLSDALGQVRTMASQGTEVFILSDFADLSEAASRHLRVLARHTFTRCVLVHDPLESEAPSPGQYRVSNGQQIVAIGLASKASRAAWVGPFEARLAALRQLCHDSGARLELLSTASSGLGFAPAGPPADPRISGAQPPPLASGARS
jgi:uncharacterized protein (DUF58 family)